MMKCLKSIFSLVSITTCGLFAGSADVHATPLRDAATEYKHAVKQFEIAIYERHYDRHSKRLVQDLEEAAIRMRSAAFRPDRIDRLECAWQEIQQLHPSVEAAFFSGHPICQVRPDLGLVDCWQQVNFAYMRLAEALACVFRPYESQAGIPSSVSPWNYSPAASPSFPYSGRSFAPQALAAPGLTVDRGQLRIQGQRERQTAAALSTQAIPAAPFELYGLRGQPRGATIERSQLRAALVESFLRNMIGD